MKASDRSAASRSAAEEKEESGVEQTHCPMTKEEKVALIRGMGGDTEHLLAILLALQNASEQSYIDEETAALVAEEVGLTPTKIHDVLTFYAMLSTKPVGRYVLEICNSTPCHYSKSEDIARVVLEELGVGLGETTEDGMFSAIYCPCMGACDIGPVIRVKDQVYGNLTEDKVRKLIADLRSGALVV